MIKFLTIFFLSTILLLSKEVKVGVFDFYPAFFKDKDGNIKGIYIDLIDEIARINNWKITYSYSSLNDNFNKLRNGQLDIMPGLIINEERLTFLDFSHVSVLNAWSSFNCNKKYKIKSVNDLNNKRIGLIKNDINNEPFLAILLDKHVIVQIKYYNEFSELLPEIKKDSIVGGFFRNLYYEWTDPENIVVPSGIKFPIKESFFCVPKGKNSDILFVIDSNLSQWKNDENSKYYEILDKWINPKPDYFRYIISISLILVFISFTYFLYRIYKKRIAK